MPSRKTKIRMIREYGDFLVKLLFLFGRIFCPGFFQFAERETVSSAYRVSSFGGGAIWAKADGI